MGRRAATIDVRAEYARSEALQRAIVVLKAAIQRANLPIFERIFELAEIKTRLKLLNDLDTKHGTELGYNGTEFQYDATFRKLEVLEMVRQLEVQADRL